MAVVAPGLAQLGIYSYGRETKTPPNANYIIDVSQMRDPLSNRGFSKKYTDGRPLEVVNFVKEDTRIPAILNQVGLLAHLNFKSPSQTSSWIAIAFKDVQGLWISPAVAEIAAAYLSDHHYRVSVFHFGIVERNK